MLTREDIVLFADTFYTEGARLRREPSFSICALFKRSFRFFSEREKDIFGFVDFFLVS